MTVLQFWRRFLIGYVNVSVHFDSNWRLIVSVVLFVFSAIHLVVRPFKNAAENLFELLQSMALIFFFVNELSLTRMAHTT